MRRWKKHEKREVANEREREAAEAEGSRVVTKNGCQDVQPPPDWELPKCVTIQQEGKCHERRAKFWHGEEFCERTCGLCKPDAAQVEAEAASYATAPANR